MASLMDWGGRTSGWSYARLARVAGWIGIAQLGLIYLLGLKTAPATETPPTRSDADWLWLPRAPALFEELPDRAVLAEVTVHGFSGALWSRRSGTALASLGSEGGVGRLAAGRAVGPRFSPGQWGDAVAPLAGIVRVAPVDRPARRMVQARTETPAPGTHLRLEGALAGRRFRGPETLPAWPHSEVLTPSTVPLLVDRDGTVLSARLLPPGSGLAAADQEAVRLAQQLQFEVGGEEDRASGEFFWGSVTFIWRTLAPAPSP